MPDVDNVVEHIHDWKKTGEYFATQNPIYIVVCACGAAGEMYIYGSQAGTVVVKQTSGSEELPGAKEALGR
jgi:hypothetical protein